MKTENSWKYKSLAQLTGIDMGNPADAPTELVRRCIIVFSVPLNQYSIEDLRMMISQQFHLNYLLPLAIEKLQDKLFSEGDYYEGDLLISVLKIDTTVWAQYPDLWKQVNRLIENKLDELDAKGISYEKFNEPLS